MIAIVTPDTDTPAETFVRQHIRKVSPGNTAVVYFEGEGKAVQQIPSYKIVSSTKNSLLRKAISLYNLLIYGYTNVPFGKSKKEVVQFLKNNKVNAMLAEFGTTGCALYPICRKLGIRLVVNFHGYDATVLPHRWDIRWAYKKLNKYADAFVCGSNHFADTVRNIGFSDSKIHVVPCGIEIEDFYYDHDEGRKNLVIAVGRMKEKKAPDLTIKAFYIVQKEISDAKLLVIGDGEYMERCKRIVKDYDIKNKVTFMGVQPHDVVKEKLREARVFVQHSLTAKNGDTESQGVSLLEAMASGLPVVTTRHNGFPETVEDGKTGFLVDEGDFESMGHKIIELLSDRKKSKQFGKYGRIKVETDFESNQIATKLFTILQPVVKDKKDKVNPR